MKDIIEFTQSQFQKKLSRFDRNGQQTADKSREDTGPEQLSVKRKQEAQRNKKSNISNNIEPVDSGMVFPRIPDRPEKFQIDFGLCRLFSGQ